MSSDFQELIENLSCTTLTQGLTYLNSHLLSGVHLRLGDPGQELSNVFGELGDRRVCAVRILVDTRIECLSHTDSSTSKVGVIVQTILEVKAGWWIAVTRKQREDVILQHDDGRAITGHNRKTKGDQHYQAPNPRRKTSPSTQRWYKFNSQSANYLAPPTNSITRGSFYWFWAVSLKLVPLKTTNVFFHFTLYLAWLRSGGRPSKNLIPLRSWRRFFS